MDGTVIVHAKVNCDSISQMVVICVLKIFVYISVSTLSMYALIFEYLT